MKALPVKTKLCFINKVREEHDQIINQFGADATRLANHPNEHNACIYIYIYIYI